MSFAKRLLWAVPPLLAGFGFVPALAFWVVSHRLHRPLGAALRGVRAAYLHPFDPLADPHRDVLTPFVLLALVCVVRSASAGRRALVALCGLGLLTISLAVGPPLVHVFKQTYLQDDSPPFVEMYYVFLGVYASVVLFLVGGTAYGLHRVVRRPRARLRF